jgi:hypothetical protein
MSDDEKTQFKASPTGATWVEITWILPGAGMLGRDKQVPRSQATHARIEEVSGSNAGTRTVSAIDANAYVRQIEAFLAERDAVRKAAADKRAEAVARLESTCPHCDTPRRYAGRRRLQTGGVGAEMVFGEMLTVSNVDVHIYTCPQCGSMETFADGVVAHPIAGNP